MCNISMYHEELESKEEKEKYSERNTGQEN